jgi:tryptophanyl-tRNA synthetase
MSASQPDTAIFTTDKPKEAARKVMKAFTGGRDTVEEQREKGGRPEICNVYAYYYFLFEEDDQALIDREMKCKGGKILCGECKKELANRVKAFLVDFQMKREKGREVLDQFLLKPLE